VKQKFQVGDRVVLVPAYAKVFDATDATEEDLRKVYTITRVENDIEDEWTERIWIDDETEHRFPMYYQKA
jgi:hypothetical protein